MKLEGRLCLLTLGNNDSTTIQVFKIKQEVTLKKIIVEGHRAVGSLNESF